ncbi:hypothetical protein [Catenisphaera adipataccumulans]|jgi:hypothetical protein|uniref:Uncharacterized protein n=1 Tax=Catenisphaera adipataccumulans TaxID=700500 RepID=A0A7W8CXJ9_9FIRM|nr:hypothetical protein [Catenisphaera adipataccumulans]MBB5182087.1 hypothetical protein [Catenisphaera adipataccumulans]
MGKKFRIWVIRIIAVVIVGGMALGMASNIFQDSSTEQTQTESTQTKTTNSYVDPDNTVELEGVGQTVLLPEGMEIQDQQKNDELGSITYSYGQTKLYTNETVAISITKMESSNGGNFDQMPILTKSEMASQTQQADSQYAAAYYTFRGDENNYCEVIRSIPEDTSSFQYQTSYCIFDADNNNYYMVTAYLLAPESADKTNRLHVDNLVKQMMSKTKYADQEVTDEFAIPEDQADQFNH